MMEDESSEGLTTDSGISVVIPDLNEEECIASVLKGLQSYGLKRIIVVDNGSTDATAERAEEAGALVVKEPQRGYGKACLTGISNLPVGTKWVLFCDADGSDDLSKLPDFFEQMGDYNFLLSNRRATAEGRANLTPVQNFGNWLSGVLMKIGWGKGFSDLGPMRMIHREALQVLKMQDENFGWTVEMQAKALEHGVKTLEIPTGYFPRQGGVSKISGNFKASVRAGQIILKTLGECWLERRRVQGSIRVLAALLLLLGGLLLGRIGDPASAAGGVPFLWGSVLLCGGFLFSLTVRTWSLKWLFAQAVLIRLCLLPMAPGDDVWRYLWEGMVQLHGINPYNTPPNAADLVLLREEWWRGINHADVTAIYPPLTQLVFRGIAQVSVSVFMFKAVFLVADLAIGALLLKHFRERAVLYLLNPIILYSFCGGAHYEPLFLLPLVAAWLLWEQRKGTGAAVLSVGILMGAAIMVKVVAVLGAGYIGWILCREAVQKRHLGAVKLMLCYSLGVLVVPLLSYMLFSILSGFPEQLYPADFTEKARTASLIPWLAEHFNTHQYNPLPNVLFLKPLLLTLVGVTLFTRSYSSFQTRSFFVLLIFSPMVHAWYVTWLVPFALEVHKRTITLFSCSIFLYFLLPYRLATTGEWHIEPFERLFLWGPVIGLIVSQPVRLFLKWVRMET